jgi:putative flippase GtrA
MKSTGILTRLSKKFSDPEFLRFLAVGAFNTAAGYVLYLGLLQVFGYRVAYSIAFVLGVLMSYALNTRYVFRQPFSWSKLLQFPLVYLAQYALGIALLYVLVEVLSVAAFAAPLIVVVVSVPVTFILSRKIIK